MSRLQAQLDRLYPPAQPGGLRTLVLELASPADWATLAPLWRGVQADLGLPAPAIAVSGEGLQLWFSLQQPVDAERGAAFLAGLQQRYLADVEPHRLRCLPSGRDPSGHAPQVPAPLAQPDQWSAFVAPDLAPVFADTPWLDIPPNPEGQAELLAPLQSITPAALAAVLQQLPGVAPAAAMPVAAAAAVEERDPRRFLLRVMNDASVPLALRIEAAKALLSR